MLPATIDGVIARLDSIIQDSADNGDRAGYFAALYDRVTQRVRAGIAAGEFDDGPRMARFDVVFANRFLAAYDAWQIDEPTTGAWRVAFAAAERDGLTVLQHLALGMNAHINLDLGIAAVECCPGIELASMRDDFFKINGVLGSLLNVVDEETGRLEPLLGWAARSSAGLGDLIANRLIDEARDGAWRFATRLSQLAADDQPRAIALRDLEVTALGEAIVLSMPFARLMGRGESSDVPANIKVLAEGELTFRLTQ
jgi:hypothetical protein